MGILDALGKIDKLAGLALFVGAIFVGLRGYQIGKDVYGRVETVVCNYELPFGIGSVCEEEPTVVTVTPEPVIITPPPVVVASTGNDVQCVDYKQGCAGHPFMNTEYESCLGVNVQDGKCTCQVSTQCKNDIDELACYGMTHHYWEFGQCKSMPTTESIDSVTGDKVQDILDEKFVDAGGDLQDCENKGGIVVGNYFSSTQSDAITTCVPKKRQTVTTRYSLEQDCQDYCNRNNYDIGSINISSNTCVCDGVPQIHLASLTGLSIQDIDIALS